MSKPLNEKESRAQLLGWAKKYGCYEDLQRLFARYDDLLKGAKTEEERKAIQTMAIVEINNFFGASAFTNIKFKDGSSLSLDGSNRQIVEEKENKS